MTLIEGFFAFSTWPAPVIVPPVPMPETRISTLPSVSFQISSAVVLRWISGLAGFSNCCGMIASGMVAASSSALAMAPFMPFGAFGQHQFGAEQRQHLAALDRHGLRHGQDQLVALGGGGEGERDAGIAGGRLDQRRLAGRDLALGFQRLDHRDADTVLDRGDRVEEFELGQKVGLDALFLGQLVEADDRRVADGLGDRRVDAAAAGLALI